MDLILTFLRLFLTVFLLAKQSSANDVSRCPTNLSRDRYLKASSWNVCYQFHMEERPWRTAGAVCRRQGGRFVTIKEHRIQKFLIESLSDLKWPRRGVWIGANDRRSEMDWRWTTGERVKDGYSNWAPGQPSCGLLCFEDCALMKWKERDGRWHDYRCNWLEDYSFICEFDMLPPTTTTTTTTTSTTTTTTTTTTPTTTSSTTTTTSTPTTTKNTTTLFEVRVVKKLQSGYLLNGLSAKNNHSTHNVYVSNNARHDQVKQVESQSAGLTSGSLVGLVVGILIGLSCAVCFIFFILLKRRKRKQSIEEDPQISYENPYYGEAPNLVFTPNCYRRDDHNDEDNNRNGGHDIGCASGGYSEDTEYLKPQQKGCADSSQETLKLKLPPPPSPLHSKPKLVMNNYDTPPTLTAPKRLSAGVSDNARRNIKSERSDLHDKNKYATMTAPDDGDDHYSQVHSRMTNKSTYDVPQSQNELDYANGATAAGVAMLDKDSFNENDYYNEEENMYESLESLTTVTAPDNNEEDEMKKMLITSPGLPFVEREETGYEVENMYVNGLKENTYVPLKTEDNIYY